MAAQARRSPDAGGSGKIRVGVSACLLGHEVRYDGGHKRDGYVADTLGRFFELVPVCPEHELGLGVPREAMRLVGDAAAPRLVTQKSGIDHTEPMLSWSRKRAGELAGEGLSGFIFKSRSPSSGMARVKVYPAGSGVAARSGVGLFARIFMERFPLLPVEEEGRLNDPALRENFIERVFVMRRWQDLVARERSRGGLVDFHTRHKLLVRAHSLECYRALGRLVAGGSSGGLDALLRQNEALLMQGLRLLATRRKHADVLMHCLGYFKQQLASDEKQEMLEVIDRYKAGHLPLIVPITLLNRHIRKHGQPYLADQVYLVPHPPELDLRNHV
jgi:uncharacterized protein YbgA (DUF1722 family)/uncharacterized protein YbbK (DUF523 family)